MMPAFDIHLEGIDAIVVEDDPTSSHLISRSLENHGARVVTAGNGIEGLELFMQYHFPIIVTDINMPGMSGLELVSRVRTLDNNVHFIATSVNRETSCLISAIELGFSEYLLKPIEIEKLLLAVKRCQNIITARQQLEDERSKFRSVIESLGEGITIKDLENRIVYQNRAMTEMFGDRTGQGCFTLFGLDTPCLNCPTIQAMNDGQPHSACRSYDAGESTLHIESTASLIRDSRGMVTGTVEIIRDISERIRNEQIIREMAFHDPLTGLPNRRLFEDRLEQAIAKSRRYSMKFGLIYLDLDHFKEINDTLGHEAGDHVLREAGERIRECCQRDLDTISRLGGDEFCIIITDCENRENLSSIAGKIMEAFIRPIQLDDREISVSASIGIAMFPDNGTEARQLEAASDKAMYAAKKSGRNTFCFATGNEPGCEAVHV